MADRRSQLVDTGIELAMLQRFQDLLASVDTRTITEAAGVTTGSFFHHFRNRGHFADAVVARFEQLWSDSVDALVADVEALATVEGVGVRELVQRRDWEKIEAQEEQGYLFHLLWVARHRPVSEVGETLANDVLQRAYDRLFDSVVPAYAKAVAAMGREMLPPFDELDLAVTMNALVDGIQMCHRVHPDRVRDGLFSDLVASTFVALTRPRGEQAAGVDLASLEADLIPGSAWRRRPAREGETWRVIADAAAPLFDQRPVAGVKVAEVAAAGGMSTSTVYHLFGRVSAVAACGWARHLPELEAIAVLPITPDEGPIERMEQVLTRYVELGIRHRGAMEGLMTEVLADARAGGTDPISARVMDTVPLASLLTPHLRELRIRGKLRRRIDSDTLSRSIIELVTMRALATPGDPVERIIDDTFGLVLEGALVGGGAR
ncbi:MAG TPA: TetR/AcrR family transcriptional regulator [Acidimicrobiales bacterium]|nr:TetR/AcrR family transcriptional regulator [Acidimicrobiales bacterium]